MVDKNGLPTWKAKDADKFCAAGAVCAAGGRAHKANSLAMMALDENTGSYGDAVCYNDAPSRRKQDVIKLFKRTINNVQNYTKSLN